MTRRKDRNTMTSTELITTEQVAEVLLHGADMDVVSPDAVQDDMVRRVLEATSVEEAFSSFEATPATALEGIAININGVAWMRSAFEEGPKIYALLDVTVEETGEKLTVSMGGRTLMASLLWAAQHEAMPIRGAFVKGRSNSNTERQFWTFNLAPLKVSA